MLPWVNSFNIYTYVVKDGEQLKPAAPESKFSVDNYPLCLSYTVQCTLSEQSGDC